MHYEIQNLSLWQSYCYADLAVFCLICPETIASAHLAYLRRDGQAELASMVGFNTKTVYSRVVTHPSTNPARRRVEFGEH